MHSTQVFAVGLAILTIGLAASSAHAASIVAAPGADAQAARRLESGLNHRQGCSGPA